MNLSFNFYYFKINNKKNKSYYKIFSNQFKYKTIVNFNSVFVL